MTGVLIAFSVTSPLLGLITRVVWALPLFPTMAFVLTASAELQAMQYYFPTRQAFCPRHRRLPTLKARLLPLTTPLLQTTPPFRLPPLLLA